MSCDLEPPETRANPGRPRPVARDTRFRGSILPVSRSGHFAPPSPRVNRCVVTPTPRLRNPRARRHLSVRGAWDPAPPPSTTTLAHRTSSPALAIPSLLISLATRRAHRTTVSRLLASRRVGRVRDMNQRADRMLDAFDRAARVREGYRLLAERYGEPRRETRAERADPLPHLLRVIIAQNTSRPNQERALAALWARFPDPALIAEAPLIEVIDAIHSAGLANTKAPRLKMLIERLLESTDGTLDLGFLYDMPVDEARDFLMALPGIGPLSASLVMLFSLRRPVLPVNTGLHRVARRVGMIPPNVGAERAHALLQRPLEDEQIFSFHINMVRHARVVCTASRPRCDHCPLAPICQWVNSGVGH